MFDLKELTAELRTWEWGIDNNNHLTQPFYAAVENALRPILEETSVQAALTVFNQIHEDLISHEGFSIGANEYGDLCATKPIGDQLRVTINITRSLRNMMTCGSRDNESRRLVSSAMRDLANEMDRAIEADRQD